MVGYPEVTFRGSGSQGVSRQFTTDYVD